MIKLFDDICANRSKPTYKIKDVGNGNKGRDLFTFSRQVGDWELTVSRRLNPYINEPRGNSFYTRLKGINALSLYRDNSVDCPLGLY